MKNTKSKLLSLFLILGMALTSLTLISAESYDDFSITPHLPENQIDQSAGYFDLLLEPDTQQTLEVDLKNLGDKPMVATILLADGTTGNNATKQFSVVSEKDESLKTPLTEFAKLEKNQIRVEGNQTETIRINIDTKDINFDGIRLGGLTVIADYADTENQPTDTTSGISINNRIAYTLGLQVRMNQTPINANLNYKGTTGEVVDLQAKFVSTIQNDQPVLMNNVKISGEIKDKANQKVVAVVDRQEGGILPNTHFNVAYDLSETKLSAGTYLVSLEISNEQGNWKWTDEIDVTSQDSETVNEGVVDFNKKNDFPYVLVWSLVGIIVLMILFFIIWKRKKDKEDETAVNRDIRK